MRLKDIEIKKLQNENDNLKIENKSISEMLNQSLEKEKKEPAADDLYRPPMAKNISYDNECTICVVDLNKDKYVKDAKG